MPSFDCLSICAAGFTMTESLDSETIPGKPYTHHGCLETIPLAFSKSVAFQNVPI